MKNVTLFLLFFPALLTAQIEPFFIQGNTHYQNGQYREAIESYESVLQAGFTSPELYYNLGNAYFKLDERGKAVLYFEKAKKLAPRDADIAQETLEMTRNQILLQAGVAALAQANQLPQAVLQLLS